MTTQKKPRDPSTTTQLDGHEPSFTFPRPVFAPPKLKPAKKAKRPGSAFGLPKS